MKKILIFSLFGLFVVSILVIPSAEAAYVPYGGGLEGSPTGSGTEQYGEALREPSLNLEQFSIFNMDYTTRGLTKLMIGIPVTPVGSQNQGLSQVQAPQDYGAFGSIVNLTADLYIQKPISGVEYFANLGRNLGFIKPAYAQERGGFRLLTPIQDLWIISRNLAYLAFVLVFVAIGFMIMLRARIDPRTVATVQAAIPGIIIALILVTLSYALAGLVIDITQLLIRLVVEALKPVMTINIEELQDQNIFRIILDLMGITQSNAQGIIRDILEAIPGTLARIVEGLADTAIGGGIIALIFGILVVFTAFRVFIMLLTALVTIVLMTIGAPFMFLFSAIPGRGGAIVGWLRSIGSAAFTFPLTFLLLAISAVFLGVTNPDTWGVEEQMGPFNIDLVPLGKFLPLDPETGEPTGGPAVPIAQIIGLGILLLTPRVTDMIREAFAQRVPEWAGEPGRAIGGMVKRFIPFA